MLIAILKANNIKKIVASPGTTHMSFVGNVLQDPFFEVYSEIDERNAAYMACGLAYESGEAVVITCTGATASRNFIPGLTEAFHRKLPIIAVTGAYDRSNTGHLLPQFIDRSSVPEELVKLSVHLQVVKDKTDEWDCNVKINKAVLECFRHGGGPVHINFTTISHAKFSMDALPATRIIKRFFTGDDLPKIPENTRIAISVGAHHPWTVEETQAIDRFCEAYNAVVLVDHSSNYYGKHRILPTIITSQEYYPDDLFQFDLLLHIGEHSGDYYTYGALHHVREVWRISKDGEIRDTFHKLTNVFEMSEKTFFLSYARDQKKVAMTEYLRLKSAVSELYKIIPDMPLSNIWVAKNMSARLPANSMVQLGVSNTMRSWTFFELPENIKSIANIGCRGIDGTLSAVTGMSLVNPDKLYFCILGDLTFFYNVNALGNRNIGNNLRILVINNGSGGEFHLYCHPCRSFWKDDVEAFIAGSGHFGNKSRTLVKHYAEAMGFEYLSAETKETVLNVMERFLSPDMTEKPMLLEIFTECDSESDALKIIRNLISAPEKEVTIKEKVKKALPKAIMDKVHDIKKAYHCLKGNEPQ